MKVKINIYYLILFALIQFPLRFAGLSILMYIYLYLIPLIYLIINIGWLKGLTKRICKSYASIGIVFFVILFLISIIWPIVIGTFDFSFITQYWRRFILLMIKNLFLVAVYEQHIGKSQSSIENYSLYYIYAMCLYVGFTILTILSGDLRTFLVDILYLEEKNIVDLMSPEYYTRIGWAGWAGFDATILCSIGTMFACISIIINKRNFNLQIKYLILACIMLVGNMLYGRSGMIVSLFCLCFTGFVAMLKGSYKYVLCCIGILLALILSLLILKNYVPEVSYWYNWAFSMFRNFIETGKFFDSTGSMEHLVKHMYWMPDLETLFFGDGYYTKNGLYYMQTDSGLMRLMLNYGIINYIAGWIASILILVSFSETVIKQKKNSKKNIKYILFMILIVMALFEFKGEAYYKIICILFPITFIRRKDDKCGNECL